MCFVAFVLIFSAFLFTSMNGESFFPSPSHIVLSKWIGENGRRNEKVFDSIDKETLVKTELKQLPFSQTKLIIKTNNLRFSLFTKGKILFKNTDKKYDGFGRQIHIIDISDMKKGAELFLFLSPVESRKARIENDILLTCDYDFILDSINKNTVSYLIISALFSAAIILILIGITRLLKKKKTAPRALYLSGCLADLSLILFAKCDIAQLLFNGSISGDVLLFLSYSLLGIFISSFMCSMLKINSRIITGFNSAVLSYSILRMLLFFIFLIPLSRIVLISYILLVMSFAVPIILKLFRKTKELYV